jgi:hypothetical protein
MSFDVLILLFVAFSVISSLVHKWQQRQRDNEQELRPRRSEPAPARQIPDLSEWEISQEPEPDKEASEFREVRGARPVSEVDTGPEFREVRGARRITESQFGPEYRDPLTPDSEAYTESTGAGFPARAGNPGIESRPLRRGSRQRRVRLRFDRNALVNAVLYKEILGTPRGEEMPW